MAKTEMPPHMDALDTCLLCGYCQSVCPVYREDGWESLTPRGKVFLLKQILEKNDITDKLFGKKIANKLTGFETIELEDAMEKIYNCTLCSRCETVCHVNIPFHEAWEEIREWMVKKGIKPPENAVNMYGDIANKEFHNPFKEPLAKRDEWYRDEFKLPPRAETVYFIGCMTSFYEYQVLLNTMKIFRAANLDFTTLGQDEMCCGAINALTGQLGNFKDIATHNITAIRKRGAKRVVTGCPGCLRALKKYNKYVDYDFEVIHTMQLIDEIIQNGQLEFKKPVKEKSLPIIFHDPCELGRILEYEEKGVFEQPRRILRSVPGIDEILEYPNNRMDSVCCGGGGGLKAVNYDLSAGVALRKIDEAVELGAKTIVSSCPNISNI